MHSRNKKLSVITCLSDQQECRYWEVNLVEWGGNMLKGDRINLYLFIFLDILICGFIKLLLFYILLFKIYPENNE